MTTSRRDFFKSGLFSAVAGATVVSGLHLLGTKEAKAATEHPFPYSPLNIETTRQWGYDGYKGVYGGKHCAFGAFHAIIGQLANVIGSPFDQVPTRMMEWASGGVVGFATFCGALNGASAAIGLVLDNDNAKPLISDLLSWHAETELPTNLVGDGQNLPTSIARGNLCHMSVTNWCLGAGYASGSSERSERCARMTGDIAAKTVELLNDGVVDLTVPGDKTGCRSCHYKGTDYEGGQFTRGKMDCEACHVDLTQVNPSHPSGHEYKDKDKHKHKDKHDSC